VAGHRPRHSRWVYCTLTNNSERGGRAPRPGRRQPARQQHDGPDHPLARGGRLFDGTRFEWNHLLLAGDPANERPRPRATSRRCLSCPDTLAFDARGVLWIGTDVSSAQLGKGEMARLGNNQLLACNPDTGEVRRFLTGPVGCELTGATFTPDGRTLFVNIQHPGESPSERSDPADPRRHSQLARLQPDRPAAFGHGGGHCPGR
jgi:secreted PhoX family phosphatase